MRGRVALALGVAQGGARAGDVGVDAVEELAGGAPVQGQGREDEGLAAEEIELVDEQGKGGELGGGGDDVITGGNDTDICIGGDGNDTFSGCEGEQQ